MLGNRSGSAFSRFFRADYIADNPARGVKLPVLKTVRPKFALTHDQASRLLSELPDLARTMVGFDILTGLRRGELFALRWKHVDWHARVLTIEDAVYDGKFGSPKTEAGNRIIPLGGAALEFLSEWRVKTQWLGEQDLIFCTRSGKSISPNNTLRRSVFPACDRIGLPKVTWLTFRRTYSSWAHDSGVAAKVIARLMGHANIDVILNVYTQVMDSSLRSAAEKVGAHLVLSTIGHKKEGQSPLVN
jgi:integrase